MPSILDDLLSGLPSVSPVRQPVAPAAPAPNRLLSLGNDSFANTAATLANENAAASPFTRSMVSALDGDSTGAARIARAKALVSGDTDGLASAEMELRQRQRTQMATPTIGSMGAREALQKGDFGNYAQNMLGMATGSMAEPMLGALLGGGAGVRGALGALGGSALGSYDVIRNAEMNTIAGDEQLSTLTPEQQLELTRNSAIPQAALESLAPAYLALGGRLPGALARIPAAARAAGMVVGEGVEESAQDAISQTMQQRYFPDRQFDVGQNIDNFAAGVVGGGGMAVLDSNGAPAAPGQAALGPLADRAGAALDAVKNRVTPALAATKDRVQAVAGTAADKGTELVDAAKDKAPGIVENARGVYDDIVEKYGDDVRDLGTKALATGRKAADGINATLARTRDALKDDTLNPQQKIARILNRDSDQAEADNLPDDQSPEILNASDPMSAMGKRDAERMARLPVQAEQLLALDISDRERARIEAAKADGFQNEEDQSYIRSRLTAVRTGERFVNAIDDFSEYAQTMAEKAKKAASSTVKNVQDKIIGPAGDALSEAKKSAQDRVMSRNSLMDASREEKADMYQRVYKYLTPEAKSVPNIGEKIPMLAAALHALSARTGDVTPADMKVLMKAKDLLPMFSDPEAMAKELSTFTSTNTGERNNWLQRIKDISLAENDISGENGQQKEDTFLYQLIPEQNRDAISAKGYTRLARAVDGFFTASPAEQEGALQALTAVYGTKDKAQQVLDFYYRDTNPGIYQFNDALDAAENSGESDERNVPGAEFGALTEQDARELTATYRSREPARPFMRGMHDTERDAALKAGGPDARIGSMREYVAQTKENPTFALSRIRRDLDKRIKNDMARDPKSLKAQLAAMESVPMEDRPDGFAQKMDALVKRIGNKSNEDRTENLARLTKERDALNEVAGVRTSDITKSRRRIMALEQLPEGDARRKKIPGLQKTLAQQNKTYEQSVAKALDLYDVVMQDKDQTFATDEEFERFGKRLEQTGDPKTGSSEKRAATMAKNARIAKTKFNVFFKDGAKRSVSGDSLFNESRVNGSISARVLDSMAAIMARPDFERFEGLTADTVVHMDDRGTDTTWGDIAPNGLDTKESTSSVFVPMTKKAKAERRKAFKEQARDTEDLNTRARVDKFVAGLREQYLNEALDGKEGSTKQLLQQMSSKDEIALRQEAEEAVFAKMFQIGEQISKAPTKPNDYAAQSRERVVNDWLRRAIEERIPLDNREIDEDEGTIGFDTERMEQSEIAQNVAFAEEMTNIQSPAGRNVAVRMQELESEFDVQLDRYRAARGIPKLEAMFADKMDSADDQLNLLGSSVQSPEQRTRDTPGLAIQSAPFSLENLTREGRRLKASRTEALNRGPQTERTMLGFDDKIEEIAGKVVRAQGVEDERQSRQQANDNVEASVEANRAELQKITEQIMNGTYQPNAQLQKMLDDELFDMGIEDKRLANPLPPNFEETPDLPPVQVKNPDGTVTPTPASEKLISDSRYVPDSKVAKVEAAVADVLGMPHEDRSKRLNTPKKIANFTMMAIDTYDRVMGDLNAEMREHYERATDERILLAGRIRDAFMDTTSGRPSWEQDMTEAGATREQRKEVENMIQQFQGKLRNLVNFSAIGEIPGQHVPAGDTIGRVGEILKKEIARIRGPEVAVAYDRLVKDLGGSGKYTINGDKSARLIEVAMNAADPLGTAWHESLHDFFSTLDETPQLRTIKKDLVDASHAPHINRQLNRLLDAHPAAKEQLNDNEERVAYMYQFWAHGKLTLSDKNNGVLEKIRNFFRDLFGVISKESRAESLMTALHDGRFSKPSVVAEVLADLNEAEGERLHSTIDRVLPALNKTTKVLFEAAPDRLRSYNNQYLTKLADLFSSERGELGFIQRRFQQEGVWKNQLESILAGTTAVQRREARDELASQQEPTTALGKAMKKLFKDLHDYQLSAGVQTYNEQADKWIPLREVKNFFPRLWDPHAITREREDFLEALVKTGKVNRKQADEMADRLINGFEKRPPQEGVQLGFQPYAPSTNQRLLTFINEQNAADFAKFQMKDLTDTTMQYIRQAVHRSEYARSFGNDGKVISELVSDSGVNKTDELEEISRVVQGLEGSLNPGDWSRSTKELMTGAMTWQNLTVMPLALASQMVDPIVLAARTGSVKDALSAYGTALQRLTGQKADGEELAKTLGIIAQDTMMEAMGSAYGAQYQSNTVKRINEAFFKYNGMQGWNNSMRIAATAAGERYLLANKNKPAALSELGLTASDIQADAKGRLVLNDATTQAMYRFVDQAVLRPSASNRPLWMSDPRFVLFGHLKQFTFAMHNVVLKRANQQAANGNLKPWHTLALTMPVMLAADMGKFALTGGAPAAWGAFDYAKHAVARSGLLGLGDFGLQATEGISRGGMPGEALLGPTFENTMDILRFAGGDANTTFRDVTNRTVPFARFVP